jgi:DNA polymerase III epsilon subunit-like protein
MEKFLTNIKLDNLKQLSKILQKEITFVDLETTGLVHENNFSIIEIGFVHITPTTIIEESSLINPQIYIPPGITEITKISNEMVKNKPLFKNFIPYIKTISENNILCGFNSRPFDSKGLEKMCKQFGVHINFKNQIDIRQVFIKTRNELLGVRSQAGKLTDASNFYNVKLSGQPHRANYDIALTVILAESIIQNSGIDSLNNEILKFNCDFTKKLFFNSIRNNNKLKNFKK